MSKCRKNTFWGRETTRAECPECGEVFLAELPESHCARSESEAAAGELAKLIYRQLEKQEGGCYNRLVKMAEERILAGSHAG